ncbi:MAG: hypothetical protein H6606_07455 [Flavobacteriales bacterium]|nr:hypothetical protein [Flavobacteriales bacterium]
MRVLGISILLLLCGSVVAQDNPYLPRFGLQSSGDDVLVYWSTAGGFTCADLSVEFGLDSIIMEAIYRYPGICGSESVEMSYQFLHRSVPENRTLFYRIDLGIFGKSKLLSIRRRTIRSGFRIDPHPAGPGSIVYFETTGSIDVEVNVYSCTGQNLRTIRKAGLRKIALSELDLPGSGSYILELTLNGVRHRERFLYTAN